MDANDKIGEELTVKLFAGVVNIAMPYTENSTAGAMMRAVVNIMKKVMHLEADGGDDGVIPATKRGRGDGEDVRK